MDEQIDVNRRRWDELAALHTRTYGIDAADASGSHSLRPLELEELGDLRGLRLCQLQCHLGGDAIALARLGASVVGIDFSQASISIAQRRAERTGLSDRVSFVCATVAEAASSVDGEFDGVYTSWGVLCWLPHLSEWARAIACLLKDDGWLYLAETHPYAAAVRRLGAEYGGGIAFFDDSQGDYTDDEAVLENPESWEWNHGLGEIVSELIRAGLHLEWLHEHAVVPWHLNDKQHLSQDSDGMWHQAGSQLPLSFSLLATKISSRSPQIRKPG